MCKDCITHTAPAGSYTRTDEEDWKARAEKAERAAQTLSKVIEDQCRDIARITRSEHMVNADGDADWGAIWERGHDMAQRLHDAEARIDELRDQVGLAVREKDEWKANAEEAERRAEQPRPPEAEKIEAIIIDQVAGDLAPAAVRTLADRIATEVQP